MKIYDDDIKNAEKTRAAAKSGKYDDMLKNHLEGKHAAFFIHGDGGADDYERSKHPEAYEKEAHRGEGVYSDPKLSVMTLVLQCKYSGIFVPDDLVVGIHVNEGKSYAEANDEYKENEEFFKAGKDLVGRLVDYIIETKMVYDKDITDNIEALTDVIGTVKLMTKSTKQSKTVGLNIS